MKNDADSRINEQHFRVVIFGSARIERGDQNWNLSIETGIVKVADGTDMAEGRARIPYRTGKVDIHSLSALAIKKLEIMRGTKRPVRIVVSMENPAGIFQIEWFLERKILSSGLEDFIEVIALQEGKEIKAFTWGNSR